MEILILVLALALLVVATVVFGADSRPTDDARPTQWYPADPND
jgi:hypothetical protein